MSDTPNSDAAKRYAEGVVRGKILACRYAQLACQRYLDDLKASKSKTFAYRYDANLAECVCEFIQALPHTKGKWALKKEPVVLEPWQKFIVCNLFGWLDKKTGLRRFLEGYHEIPRKNGKSVLAAGIGLWMFAMDGEFGSEVYSGATSEKQAWEVFRPAKLISMRTEELREECGIEVNAASLVLPEDYSRFEPVIGSPGDGASPSCAIVDEFHEHATAALYDTMITGMGARDQPLMFVITTAGDNIEGPCYEMRRRVIDMLEGNQPDDRLFGIIYTLDEGDDWRDPAILGKANPNFGVSIKADYLERQQQLAIHNTGKQNRFKCKHLNVWVGAQNAFFNMEKWKSAEDKTLREEDFADADCYYALDLASRIDVCAGVKVFRRDIDNKRHYFLFPRFWLPSAVVERAAERSEEKGNVERYQRWSEQGHIDLIDGEEVNFNEVRDDVIADAENLRVLEVPHDNWGAFVLAPDLEKAGLLPVKVPQQTAYLSPAMREFEAALYSGRVHHPGHPVLTWMVGNVVAKPDKNDNVFPNRSKDGQKIDGAVAAIMGIGRAMIGAPKEVSIYDEEFAI